MKKHTPSAAALKLLNKATTPTKICTYLNTNFHNIEPFTDYLTKQRMVVQLATVWNKGNWAIDAYVHHSDQDSSKASSGAAKSFLVALKRAVTQWNKDNKPKTPSRRGAKK